MGTYNGSSSDGVGGDRGRRRRWRSLSPECGQCQTLRLHSGQARCPGEAGCRRRIEEDPTTMAKLSRTLAVLASAAVLAAACTSGGGASTAPDPTHQPPAAAPPPAWPPPRLQRARSRRRRRPTSRSVSASPRPASSRPSSPCMAGIYEKNGLTVETTVFEGDGKVMQALQAGQLDVGFGGTSAFITSQTTDVPVKGLAVNAVILTDELVSTADVKTAEDLRGKCVAVSTFGGTSHGAVILSLRGARPDPRGCRHHRGRRAERPDRRPPGWRLCRRAGRRRAPRGDGRSLGFNFLVNLKEAQAAVGPLGHGRDRGVARRQPEHRDRRRRIGPRGPEPDVDGRGHGRRALRRVHPEHARGRQGADPRVPGDRQPADDLDRRCVPEPEGRARHGQPGHGGRPGHRRLRSKRAPGPDGLGLLRGQRASRPSNPAPPLDRPRSPVPGAVVVRDRRGIAIDVRHLRRIAGRRDGRARTARRRRSDRRARGPPARRPVPRPPGRDPADGRRVHRLRRRRAPASGS